VEAILGDLDCRAAVLRLMHRLGAALKHGDDSPVTLKLIEIRGRLGLSDRRQQQAKDAG
jgi:hypothetical protein